MTPPHEQTDPSARAVPVAPVALSHLAAPDTLPAAAPSQLTGRKLLLIILALVAACGAFLLGVLGLTLFLGLKLFEVVR
jgi:hypothetical protein